MFVVDKGNVWSSGGLVLTKDGRTLLQEKLVPSTFIYHKSYMDLGGMNPVRHDENLAMDHPEAR